jgi:hypothetical protein
MPCPPTIGFSYSRKLNRVKIGFNVCVSYAVLRKNYSLT